MTEIRGRIRALLWDKDGTLLDNFSLWIRRERSLLETLCLELEIPEELRRDAIESGLTAIGVNKGRVDPHGELAGGTEASICEALANALGVFGPVPGQDRFLRLVRRHLNRIISDDNSTVPVKNGVREALEEASQRGIPQGLATSDSRESALKELAPHGLEPFFSYFSFGDEALRPKPDPWCVLEFSRFTGIPVRNILFIGDSPVDQATARSAGAMFCAVLGGAGGREDFTDETIIVEEPGELTGLLR
ncbi:HAD family hydrolase [Marispirochaeta sp.]|jgi:phosphoglycolate phosphatase|uniref:HAD family hydrolase n=1 Tax=Marispirochaeta sp. TaxID=2038653 RepID=UPI0029C628B0|nr:HAD family hydrolase [Marispirochaeta sp.]